MSQQAIDDARSIFASNLLVSTQAVPRVVLVQQSGALVRSLASMTKADSQRTLNLISFLVFENLLWLALRTNAFYVYAIKWAELRGSLGSLISICLYDRLYLLCFQFTGYFPQFNNSTNLYCSCILENECISPSVVGIYENISVRVPGDVYYDTQQPRYSVPGINAACLPYNGLLASTLECLYDTECLSEVSTSVWMPLNGSLNVTVGALVKNLFVVEWSNTSDFSAYYYACVPSLCSYTYKERITLIYMITTLIGLIGGVVTALRVIAPVLVTIALWIQDKCNTRKTENRELAITTESVQARGSFSCCCR